jgi:hypothetical protein
MMLRIVIDPVPQQKLLFPCPQCGVDLRLQVDTPQPPTIAVTSLDIEQVNVSELADDVPIVLLTSCIPVPAQALDQQRDGFVSPFLIMSNYASQEGFLHYSEASNVLYEFYGKLLAPIRRIASIYASGNTEALRKLLGSLPVIDIDEFRDFPPAYQVGRCFDLLFAPVMRLEEHWAAKQELLSLQFRGFKKHPGAYKRLLDDLVNVGRFTQFRRKVAATAITLLEDYGSLLPGMAWETFEPQPDARDFRIIRDDFDVLRARYVEIFELGSQALAYVGYLSNLVRRGDARQWCDGRSTGLQAVMDLTSHKREFITAEVPAIRVIYEAVHRRTRNKFGHYSVEYDSASGDLIDNDGNRTSYVLFLADYLSAARLALFLMTLTEKISLDLEDVASHHALITNDSS